ncbi:MAG TPA: hypothetical protein VJY33_25575, partial [Isosphaeraceae bacterium]|nr:hypothetical protein [Isosphaeraceae bacterium]
MTAASIIHRRTVIFGSHNGNPPLAPPRLYLHPDTPPRLILPAANTLGEKRPPCGFWDGSAS